jgi:hypothetical protein
VVSCRHHNSHYIQLGWLVVLASYGAQLPAIPKELNIHISVGVSSELKCLTQPSSAMCRATNFSFVGLVLTSVAMSIVHASQISDSNVERADIRCPSTKFAVCCSKTGQLGTTYSVVTNDCTCNQAGGYVVPGYQCPKLSCQLCVAPYHPVCCQLPGRRFTADPCYCLCSGGIVVPKLSTCGAWSL